MVLTAKKDYAATFVQSATSIFKHELATPLKKRSIDIKHSSKPAFPLSIIIGFVASSFKGQVVYSMEQDMGEGIAKKMLPGLLPLQQKEMVHSALGELANMISGKASITLAGNEDRIDITPPIITLGNTNFNFLDVPTIALVCDSTLGVFTINIAFQELKG